MYRRPTLHAPKLNGAALKAVSVLAHNPLLGPIIRAQMVGQVGMATLREARLTEPPTLNPDIPRHNGPSLEGLPDLSPAMAASHQKVAGWRPHTVAQFHAAYRGGKVNAEEVAARVLKATEDSDLMTPPLRAIVAQKREDVLQQAKASAARWRDGRALGPLDGVPVVIKDEVHVDGYPTTVGTRFMGSRPTGPEATAVRRLRNAGALLIGKTNMHELGMGVTGVNPNLGSPRNPYDLRRFTGGSSSGTGSAVAAGLSPLGLGADGGGSIRIPAAFCGVVGLKATFGRVSEAGAAPLCWSVAHVGPLGGTAADVALGYAVMAGIDPLDGNTAHQPPVDLTGMDDTDLSGVRLGVYWPWFEDAEPDVVAACKRALEGLKVLGATVVDIEIPDLDLVRLAHLVTIASEMAIAREAHFAAEWSEYGPDISLNMAMVESLSSADYVQAQRVRTRITRTLQDLFGRVDGIVTPTTGITAKVISPAALGSGESNLGLLESIMRYVLLANLTGVPAISVPVGQDREGMPVGLHIMGRPWEEAGLLRMAHALEGVVERRAPAFHVSLLREGEIPAE